MTHSLKMTWSWRQMNVALALVLGGVLLVSVPFGHALEIHHLFAEVDHDGHEHSEHDLCTWVQHHTGGSYIHDSYSPVIFIGIETIPHPPKQSWICSRFFRADGSRAPPCQVILHFLTQSKISSLTFWRSGIHFYRLIQGCKKFGGIQECYERKTSCNVIGNCCIWGPVFWSWVSPYVLP